MTGESNRVGRGEEGLGATVEELELYLQELLEEDDLRGEAAFVREEVIRRIAAIKLAKATVELVA